MTMQLAKLKVVTVTLNPALDLTGHLQTLTKGAVNQVKHCVLGSYFRVTTSKS